MPNEETGNGTTIPKDKLWEWLYRALIAVAIFWAYANFVPLEEYKKDREKAIVLEEAKLVTMNAMKETLARIDERSKLDDTKPRVQALENRVNSLERKLPDDEQR